MTLLKVFNEALKQIPEKADELLKKLDATEKLNKEEKAQATAIVRQLKKKDIIGEFHLYRNYVLMKSLTIRLSPAECGVKDSDTFSEETTEKAIKHMEKLIRYLNSISNDIQFSYGGGREEPGNEIAEFMIDWVF